MNSFIFLDMDGVLNHPGTYSRFYDEDCVNHAVWPDDHVERSCIEVLNKITDACDAQIVLSSSWRIHFWDRMDEFRVFMKSMGVKADIIDRTPRDIPCERGDEIHRWLKENNGYGAQVLVLDDNDDMTMVKPWFYQTEGSTGLVQNDIDPCLKILFGPKWCWPEADIDGLVRRGWKG